MKQKWAIRLPLTLSESTDKTCPEYSYKDLLKQQSLRRLGKESLGEVLNGPTREKEDPLASDEDEALKALAHQLEQKYGTSHDQKKRRKRQKDNDFKQLGEGYDETDPFIDNSDAIDDVLPTNVETKHGGFYINLGRLNFEEFPEEEEEKSSSLDVLLAKTARKNQISSSDDESTEVTESEANPICENGSVSSKKRKLDEGELLRQRKKMIDKFNAKKLKKSDENTKKVTETPSKPAAQYSDVNSKCLNGASSIAASIEAVVNKSRVTTDDKTSDEKNKLNEQESNGISLLENGKRDKSGEGVDALNGFGLHQSSPSNADSGSSSESESEEVTDVTKVEVTPAAIIGSRDRPSIPLNEDEASSDSAEETEETLPKEKEKTKDCPLPDGLPPSLIAVIEKIKEEGKNTKSSSKKFFSESVNKLLLSIEIKLCKCGKSKRNAVFAHLSQHLPCSSQTLIKRGKNLLSEKLDERLREPIQKLRDTVERIMKPVLEKHKEECIKVTERNNEQAIENDIDGEKVAKVKFKFPKKIFELSDELRLLLCDVVRIRCQGWHMIKKRAEDPEEHVKAFIEERLKPLWPKGWVTTKKLYKQSHSAHSFLTSKSTDKVQKPTISTDDSTSNCNILSPAPSSSLDQAATEISGKHKQQKSAETAESHSTSNSVSHAKSTLTSLSYNKDVNNESQVNDKKKEILQNSARSCDRETPKTAPSFSSVQSAKESVDKDSKNKGDFHPLIRPIPLPSNPKEQTSVLSHAPIILESPKVFHGFEPQKSPEPSSRAKQQLKFEADTKKQSTSVDFSTDGPSAIREGRPPKPSLTATALPKVKLQSSVSISRNNTFTPQTQRDDSHKVPSEADKKVPVLVEGPRSSESKLPDKKNDFRIIDISSDEENSVEINNYTNSSRGQKTLDRRPPCSVPQRANSDLQNMNHHRLSSDNSTKMAVSSSDSNRNKLEKEMDHVMNELLQISKKNLKAPDFDNSVNYSQAQRTPSSQNQTSIRSPAPSKIYDNPSSAHVLKNHPQMAHTNCQKQMPRQSTSGSQQVSSHSVSSILSSQLEGHSPGNNFDAPQTMSSKIAHNSSKLELGRNLNSASTFASQHSRGLPTMNSYDSINAVRNNLSSVSSPPSQKKIVTNSTLPSRSGNHSFSTAAQNLGSSHSSHKSSTPNPTTKPSVQPTVASQFSHSSWTSPQTSRSSGISYTSSPKMGTSLCGEGKIPTSQGIYKQNSLPMESATSSTSLSHSQAMPHDIPLAMNSQRSMPANPSLSSNAHANARTQPHDLTHGANNQRSLPINSNSPTKVPPLSRSHLHESYPSKSFQHYQAEPRPSQSKPITLDDRISTGRKENAQMHNPCYQSRPKLPGSVGANSNFSPPQIVKSQNSYVSASHQQSLSRSNRLPSHNIDGLLYNTNMSPSSKVPYYPPHSSVPSSSSSSKQSYPQKPQPKIGHSPSSSWPEEAILSALDSPRHVVSGTKGTYPPPRHRTSDSSSFSMAGDGKQDTLLANLRLMEGLSVSNIPVKSRSGSDIVLPTANQRTQRSNNGGSSDTKQRTRYDSHPGIESLSPTKLPNDYWAPRVSQSSSQSSSSNRLPPKQ